MMLNAFAALRRLRLRSLADELEIERLTAERDQSDAKFKQAVTDLAAQAEEIAGYRQALARAEHMMDQASERLSEIREERDALRPDAEAMRKKRDADRKRMAGKRKGGSITAPKDGLVAINAEQAQP